jgi:hypothetical protein
MGRVSIDLYKQSNLLEGVNEGYAVANLRVARTSEDHLFVKNIIVARTKGVPGSELDTLGRTT